MSHANKTVSLAGTVIIMLVIISGCMPRPEPVNIIKSRPPAEKKMKVEKKAEKVKKDKFVWVQQPIEEESVVKAASKQAGYLMNFDDIAVPDFIETMMTGVFKQNYLITDAARAVTRRITIKMTEDLKADQAFGLFIQILRMLEVTVEKKENTYVFDVSQKGPTVSMRGALIYGRHIPGNLSLSGGEELTMLIPFYNIDPGILKAVLEKMMPPQAVVVPVPELHLLVINGNYDDIKYLLTFIDLLDRSQFREKSIVMVTPEYWDIDDFEEKVKELLAAEGLQPAAAEKSGGILFIPIQKLNSLIIISPVNEWIQRVLYWLEKLDIPAAAGEAKKVFAYKLKNVQVDAVYEILQSYALGTSPDLSQLSSRRSLMDIAVSGIKDNNTTGKAESPSPTGQNVTVRDLPGTGKNTKPGITGENQVEGQAIIIPVLETNSVVIIATPVEYKKYMDIIQRIDVPRQQVFVEVIIGEISLDTSTQLGLEFWVNRYLNKTRFGTKGGLGVYKGQDQSGNPIMPLGGNFFLNGVLEGSQYEVLMNALVENSQIDIISTPKLTVVENEEAEISVGSDVPVIASETAISSGQIGNLYPVRSVQYINTGIILKVKAAILTDNKISLDISQEISEALENTKSDISSPEILKRTVKTTLIVNEGEIAFIGGLFQKKLSTGGSGIPILSKIPLLGSLFKNEKKQMKKTELVVFINSRTIRKHNDMKEIVEAVKKLYSVKSNVISNAEKEQ